MSIADFAVTTFATLFVAIGPVDTALVFGGLTGGVHRPDRFRLALRAVLIAGGVLLGFALFAVQLLSTLQVSLEAFRFAGGVLLLLQAIQLIFGHPGGLSTLTAGERREALEPGDIAIFPLAYPLIAGPAGLTAFVLLMGQATGDLARSAGVLTAMLICLLLTYAGMIFTDLLHQLLKPRDRMFLLVSRASYLLRWLRSLSSMESGTRGSSVRIEAAMRELQQLGAEVSSVAVSRWTIIET